MSTKSSDTPAPSQPATAPDSSASSRSASHRPPAPATPARTESAGDRSGPAPELKFDYCRIFPPLGVARVGNSPEKYFVGPEAPGVVPTADGSYKDEAGRIKRQAARFRVYGFRGDGTARELTLDDTDIASIRWHVSLANLKADWYQFNGTAQVAAILRGDTSFPRRHPDVPAEARRGLRITPPSVEIEGKESASPRMEGAFSPPPATEVKTVYLGEARTDHAGRLLVLGGHGDSASLWPDNPVTSYANNNGWHDDVSDGPVTVEVTLKDGSKLPVRGRSWVVVAPPHFSPFTQNAVTLYDVLASIAVDHGLAWDERELGAKPKAEVSFTHDIYPVLRRMTEYQWVSRRAHRGHAPGKRGDFLAPETLALLARPEEAAKARSLHKHLFERLRTPIIHPPFETAKKPDAYLLDPASQAAINQANLSFMPPLAGDEGDVTMGQPKTWLSLTESQYRKFARWKDGDFINDWTGRGPEPRPFEEIPVAEQPASLTRAALEACQGGAFFPGIEITSIVRFKEFYSEAFRVADNLQPGEVTRWMALPWQADFSDCGSHWWPSIRPDDVVPEWQLEKLIKEFQEEATGQNIASLLENREPWNRGVGIVVPNKPGLPRPEPGDDAATVQRWAAWRLRRLVLRFVAFLPDAAEDELSDTYARQLEEYLDQTILENPAFTLPPPETGEDLGDYRQRVQTAVLAFLNQATQLPDPNPGETGSDYFGRLTTLTENPIWEGLFQFGWAWRDIHRVKNDMIAKWHRLGFVTARTDFGQRTLVERDRGQFDLLSFRDSFYYLMNIEDHPEFLPKARELAEEYLALARELEPDLRADPSTEQYGYFRYDPVTFRARMAKIYDTERRSGEKYDPTDVASEPLFRTPAHVVERIRQLAPFNQLDGSWLERIAKSGPIDHVRSFLFEIWSDEIGNGDPAQNHANVYTNLLHSAGIYLPPLNSRAYADNPDLWEASFSSPAYQSSLALFPDTYYPELLGMTLYLEWEAIFLPAMVKLYNYHGYDSLFYRLHVAIDNPVNGHGARARDAVVDYLDHIRTESGEEEMQQHWRRIWDGYLAFKMVGNEEWTYRFNHPPSPEERMLAMIYQKSQFGQLNHGTRRLGPNSINDWFDEPEQFLPLLAASDLIVRGDAPNSRIFSLMGPTGVMYKVFNQRDLATWTDWINSLPKAPPGGALGPGEAMVILVREVAARAAGVPAHGEFLLKGKYKNPAADNRLEEVTQPVTWWFEIGQPESFLAALADPVNGWVLPGNVQGSRIFRDLLAGTGLMSRFLSMPIPELGNKPARDIFIQWIAAGCPIPGQPMPAVRARAAAAPRRSVVPERSGDRLYAADFARRIANRQPFTSEQRANLPRRNYGPGGGACH